MDKSQEAVRSGPVGAWVAVSGAAAVSCAQNEQQGGGCPAQEGS